MAGRGGRIRYSIEADSRSAERANARVAKSLGKLDKAGARVGKGFASHAKKLAAFGAGLASISTAKSAVKETVALAKATAGLSRITGLDSKAASAWVEIAKVRGVQAKQLNIGFITLARNLRAASAGTDKQVALFKRLGVSQDAIRKGDISSVINQLADKFAGMSNESQRAAIAQQLFGRQAQTLLPLLTKGSGALQEQLGLAEKYGATLDESGVKKALEAAAAQRELTLAMDGLKIAFATKVLPALTSAGRGVATFISEVRKGKDSSNQFVRGVAVGFGGAKTGVAAAVNGIKGFLRSNREDFRAVGQAAQNVGKIVSFAFREGVLPVIRRVIPAVMTILRGWAQGIRGVVRVITGVLTLDFKRAWSGVKDIFSGGVKVAAGTIRGMTAPVREAAHRAGQGLKAGFLAGVRGLESALKAALNAVIGVIEKGINAATPGKISIPLAPDIPAVPDIHLPRLARGGKLNDSRLAIVGEEGPELAALPAGTRVFSNPVTRRMMGRAFRLGFPGFSTGGIVARANKLDKAGVPYVWGGNHNDSNYNFGEGFDCSSAVSYVLGIPPRHSSLFMNYGKPGPGPVTIYSNQDHVFMSIFGRGWGTSRENPGRGPGWLSYNSPGGRFGAMAVRHLGGVHSPGYGKRGKRGNKPAKEKKGSKGKRGKSQPGKKVAGINKPQSGSFTIDDRIDRAEGVLMQQLAAGQYGWAEGTETYLADLYDQRARKNKSRAGSYKAGVEDEQHAAALRAPGILDDPRSSVEENTDSNDALTAAIEESNRLQEEANALTKEIAANQKRLEAVATTQYGVLAQAITHVVSGEIGGRVGLGLMSPGFAGGGVRY